MNGSFPMAVLVLDRACANILHPRPELIRSPQHAHSLFHDHPK